MKVQIRQSLCICRSGKNFLKPDNCVPFCRFPSICLLLTDERIQLTEMFFFPSLFCLKEVVHFPEYIRSYCFTDLIGERGIIVCDYLGKHVAEKRSYLFQLRPGNDFIRGNGSRWQSPVWKQDSFRQERLHL